MAASSFLKKNDRARGNLLANISRKVSAWWPGYRADKKEERLLTGSLLVNSGGMPGTLGGIFFAHGFNAPVFLTNYHVLFGNRAGTGEDVWLVAENGTAPDLLPLGKSIDGKIGIVQWNDQPVFIDCAFGRLQDKIKISRSTRASIIRASAEAVLGESVTKTGGATQNTSGVIINTHHHDVCRVGNTIYQACNQILIQPLPGEKFSGKGDSGALIRNSRNEMVGLLWGVTAKGEGIACPARPVIRELGIRL